MGEDGTFSMPSGDGAAAAVFCLIYSEMLSVPAVWLILPFVCCGRVYYQCHWFGDTFMGALLGAFWGQVAVSYFGIFLPLFRLVANNSEAFVKA